MVMGGDDNVPEGAVEMNDEVAIAEGEQVALLLAANLARTPVGCEGLLPCVIGAWSAALATPGGEMTEVRGLFSTMARISGTRDKSSEVIEVQTAVVAGGVRAAFLTNAARCPSGDGSVRPVVRAAMMVGALSVRVAAWVEDTLVTTLVEVTMVSGGADTTTAGISAGKPKGGAKGSRGRAGNGAFQSA